MQVKLIKKFVAFLTGSWVYGDPNSKSDIDLVIRCDDKIKTFLREYSDEEHSIRFGKLNLICATSDEQFNAWKEGTDRCLDMHNQTQLSINKKDAKKIMDQFREKYGVVDLSESEDIPIENTPDYEAIEDEEEWYGKR